MAVIDISTIERTAYMVTPSGEIPIVAAAWAGFFSKLAELSNDERQAFVTTMKLLNATVVVMPPESGG